MFIYIRVYLHLFIYSSVSPSVSELVPSNPSIAPLGLLSVCPILQEEREPIACVV